MPSSRKEELVLLLVEAEMRLRRLGDAQIWSSYESGPAIADFLVVAREQIAGGNVDTATARELWGIFAPTCDWDDSVGDVALGNAIFEIVDDLYGPETRVSRPR